MCCQHAKLVEMPNCIAARYDAGIINHKYEHTGVIEVIHLGKKEDIWKQEELVDYGTEKLNTKPEAFGTQKD